ncbi:alcohol dehydrogenase catalytic domain-containing protein [Denitrobacterium detoxificans]|jgi:ribitol-5-phosphate 2-dehydrogenase|uniref:alcohol dehydrogenase catalytic domain-containing protein n=1 Tax=Denitrobacterium detoxificans TaxID=79604 RepID=UPI0026EBE111|nr:alcohol dehydrogenase catalytic domain-containing protein [Denitrobacterium detoxificans]MBE6465535.1 ribitol-5-phosphate dehydrogenase [Denitrobacterium detoxificans]
MLNCVYRLVSPRTIEPVQVDVAVGPEDVVVRPTHLSICNADQRYFQGRRSARAMAKKLPMALIHEGIGRVAWSSNGMFEPGQRVVMLPNNPVETDDVIKENYLRSSQFCGSGYDGFMQELVVLPTSRVIALPDSISDEVAAFTELVSVAVHAVSRFGEIAHVRRETVGVWGDGNVGFIVSLVLRSMYPNMNIVVFGRNAYKLADFTFVDQTFLTTDAANAPLIDHAFECCGGDGAASAIGQIIDTIKPEGTISLMGVSENPVPVNTRMVLEKGLRMFGSSRSGRLDFERTLQLYREHPQIASYLESLVGTVNDVASIRDIAHAFDADARKPMGKTIMRWNM